MQTDEQLVDASLAGSDGAFEELVCRYQQRLLRFLLTRSASKEDAEDAIQDTFVSAYRYLYSFNPKWRFSTWIYRIALRNIARQAAASRAESEDVELLVDERSDPLQECLDESVLSNVWLTAKHVLPDDAYAAMWLRYVEDMSVKDIAKALDRSVSWAKVTLMRGRRRLESELSDAPTDPARSESYG